MCVRIGYLTRIKETLMTHNSIKLIALAIAFGCSLLGFALVPGTDGRAMIMLASLAVTGPWFFFYWFLSDRPRY